MRNTSRKSILIQQWGVLAHNIKLFDLRNSVRGRSGGAWYCKPICDGAGSRGMPPPKKSKLDEAESLFSVAFIGSKQVFGDNHPDKCLFQEDSEAICNTKA